MHTSVGRTVERYSGKDLVRGRSVFAEDNLPQNSYVLRVLRSPLHHARILNIDIQKALRVQGVAGILTASDIPGLNHYGVIIQDQPLLAEDLVRFQGESIALVVAESEEAADQALGCIDVQYQELSPVLDPEKALEPETEFVHSEGNLLRHNVVRKGDVEEGFRHSDFVLERTYHTHRVEHAYLEPDAGNGWIDDQGRYVIRVCTQNPHYDRKAVAGLLGIEEKNIRIIQSQTGGGFGGKLDLSVQGHVALALHILRRPVKMIYSREECLQVTSKRHPSKITIKSGVRADGRLLAMQARLHFDTGPYASYGVPLTLRAAIQMTGPYDIEHVDIESVSVYTNNPISGSMRGVAIVQTSFASESHMDILAQKVGMDPLAFRQKNAMQAGSITATGQVLDHSVGIGQTLHDLGIPYLEAQKWKQSCPRGPIKRGIGFGAMWYGIGAMAAKNPSHATMRINENGKICLHTGAADIGQGSTTIFCQIAADVLGIDPESLLVVTADTGLTLDAGATSSSRQTYVSGNAVLDAAQNMASDLLNHTAGQVNQPQCNLTLQGGHVVDSEGKKLISLSELISQIQAQDGTRQWEGFFEPSTTTIDPTTGQGIPFGTYSFASHLALVEVDEETGIPQVVKVIASQDAGKAINPQNVMGQIQGGVGMGLGYALMEDFLPGKTISLSEYHIPTSMDIPPIQCSFVQDPEPTGPYGAKGMGEPSLAPTAPAIVNAITDALGQRLYHLPATPEALRALIRQSEM